MTGPEPEQAEQQEPAEQPSAEQEQADPKRGRPDWPNQQMVRPDGSGPGLPPEGTGGSSMPAAAAASTGDDLDAMTKAELLEYAQQIGVSPANNNMTKEELREGVDAKLEEAPGE